MRSELFRFVRGATIWTYTSSDTAVDYNGETYSPVAIGHSERNSKNEIAKENLVVKMSLTNSLAQDLISYFGEESLILTLFVNTDAGTEVAWKGRYSSQKAKGDELHVVIESLFTALRRPGLRAKYQKTCRHVLYGSQCGVVQGSFSTSGELTDISGETVTVTEAALQADGYYTGGMIQAPDNSLRWIVNHVGSVLTLVRLFESLTVLDTVTIYPGCDHTRPTCVSKFNNVLNYGGFPWIPRKNPMAGSSII